MGSVPRSGIRVTQTPKLAELGQNLVFGPNWPLVEVVPNFGTVLAAMPPSKGVWGHASTNLNTRSRPNWGDVDRMWPNLGKNRPALEEHARPAFWKAN